MIHVAKHFNVAKYNRLENRLRSLGIGLMLGFTAIAAFLAWVYKSAAYCPIDRR